MVKFAGITPKLGNGAAECEDRFSAGPQRFAVADGVSESGYSQVWARILADSFCRSAVGEVSPDELDAWLAACRAEWRSWADALALRDLPWFARETLRMGSFATFVGLAFSPGIDAASWHAVACGDACVFIVRNDELSCAFPLSDSDAFDNTPPLVATSGARGGDGLRIYDRDGAARRRVLSRDRHAWPTGSSPTTIVARSRGSRSNGISTAHDLDAFVSASRESRALKNDDVTLVSIVIVADE